MLGISKSLQALRGLKAAHYHMSAFTARVVPVVFPSVSESITDGQVIAIHVTPGQKVNVDDNLLSIATDKVAVDIRAEIAGVVKSIFTKADETVPILTKVLLEIDTEGVASSAPAAASAASAPAAPQAQAAAAPTSTSTPAQTSAHVAHRVPLIKFRYGKRDGASAAPSHTGAKTASPNVAPLIFGNYNQLLDKLMPSKASKSYLDLPSGFGRPKLSPAEIAAIESGGAY